MVDSSTALWLIAMVLYSPERLRHRKHRALLQRIAHAIVCITATGRQRLEFHKVRAHIGVHGNYRADAAAKHAAGANDPDLPTPTNHCDPATALPSTGTSWVKHLVQDKCQQADTPPTYHYQAVDNLKQQVKKQAHRLFQARLRKNDQERLFEARLGRKRTLQIHGRRQTGHHLPIHKG